MSTISLFRTSIGKKILSAVSGLLLGIFLFAHMLGNAASFFGTAAYNAYAAHLHRLGPFLLVPETILALVFVIHAATGLLLFIENRKARPCRYSVSRPLSLSINASTMPYTGGVILIFLAAHLFHFHFAGSDSSIAALVRGTLAQAPTGFFYLSALLALGLHLSHGFWSLLQTLGVNHPRYNGFFILTGLGGGIVISGVFMLIVLLALLSDSFLI